MQWITEEKVDGESQSIELKTDTPVISYSCPGKHLHQFRLFCIISSFELGSHTEQTDR